MCDPAVCHGEGQHLELPALRLCLGYQVTTITSCIAVVSGSTDCLVASVLFGCVVMYVL